MVSSSLNFRQKSNTLKRPIRRVALSCIQCRSRKLKCDATLPNCERCLANGKTWEYQKTRCGGRPRRPVTIPLQPVTDDDLPLVEDRAVSPWSWGKDSGTTAAYVSNSRTSSESGTTVSSAQSIADSFEFMSRLESTTSTILHLTQVQIDQLLTGYFVYFHVAHPCVLPRSSLQCRLIAEPVASDVSLLVLLYISSIFTPTKRAGSAPGTLDPYYVQALVLQSIAVYASNEPERARSLLHEAIQSALSIGMHKAEFTSQHGRGDAILEESWRRTWWTVYTTDAHIAGSTHSYPTQTGAVHITADLPCEEQQYESGNIPIPATLRSYSMREFGEVDFSSFAQLIGFTLGIYRALATRRMDDIENAKVTAKNADTVMTAWCSLLPASKRRILREDGSVDELLFKVNILMHTYITDIHRQLSNFKYFSIESVPQCVAPHPPESNDSIKDEAHIHTAKVLYSTDKLNSLLTLPAHVTSYTPFIICMITLTTIAQLFACRYIFQEPKLSLERGKTRLNVGVLKLTGEAWHSEQRVPRHGHHRERDVEPER
ncbi:hypothetical protein EK21DRAFT_97443 [Setomelanomma holmii]|uniref:Zn(2)-C6 fungal-type domain-containing protein n=1 Tax=Setomelanomma holmii TaxID=210430 RepID=A0A9P4HFQ5_9PLEO|nr:hypothetical protein EK21DRAFT_97443 [Setomelanomma holmii]